MKYPLLSIIFIIQAFSCFSQSPPKKIRLRVLSIKDCNIPSDAMQLKQINFPRTVEIPGEVTFNMTGTVKRKLPSDWNAEAKLKVKMPFFNNWLDVPCMGSCDMNNLCKQEVIQYCKKYLNDTKSTMDANKVCACDYEPGEYDIPSIRLPLKNNFAKNNQEMRDYLVKSAKGKDVRLEVILRSAFDKKRFGCFRAMLKVN